MKLESGSGKQKVRSEETFCTPRKPKSRNRFLERTVFPFPDFTFPGLGISGKPPWVNPPPGRWGEFPRLVRLSECGCVFAERPRGSPRVEPSRDPPWVRFVYRSDSVSVFQSCWWQSATRSRGEVFWISSLAFPFPDSTLNETRKWKRETESAFRRNILHTAQT